MKESRSVDHQRLCVSEVSDEGHRKGKKTGTGNDVRNTKKRNSRGDIDFNSNELQVKRSRNSVADGVKSSGPFPDLSRNLNKTEPKVNRSRNSFGGGVKSDGPFLFLSQNINKTGGVNGFALSLNGSGNAIRVPKKPRGSVGIKNHVPNLSGSSSSIDQISKLNSDVKPSVSATPNLTKHAKNGGELLVIHKRSGGDASSRKWKGPGKKRKGLASDSLGVAGKVSPVVDDLGSISGDSQEEEENLEENAARMLSSRFDPRCTGRPFNSVEHIDNQIENSPGGLESPSAYNGTRTGRIKSNYKEKASSRKRRHFYEVRYSDKNARFFMNRRIKVFWPLDERWYHGLVNDYDEERKLHHVKYDDKDKEWINLQNERFLLLLLRSELTDMEKPVVSSTVDKLVKRNGKDTTMSKSDTYSESHIDSQPIISCLARSTHQSESSFCPKKQKRLHSSSIALSVLSGKITNARENGNVDCSEKETSGVCISDSADRLAGKANGRQLMLEHCTSSKEFGLPIVYFRRRFHKKKDGPFRFPVDTCGLRILPRCLASIADTSQTSYKRNVSSDSLYPDNLIWSIGSDGMLKLNLALVARVESFIDLSSPVCYFLDFSFGVDTFRFFHLPLLPQYGSIVTTWPNVYLDMLFIDNEVGLRFFMLEGCLKQAVTFVLLVLSVFREPNIAKESVDVQMPAISIRFKISYTKDLRKQHIFSFYSFSKLKISRWLYLDSVFQNRCLFAKKLPLPDCTLENIKALESRSKCRNSVTWESFECAGTKSFQDIIPIGVMKPANVTMMQSANYDGKNGRLPFALSFSAAPPFFRSLHLQLLMDYSIACVRLRDCNSVCSLEHLGITRKSVTTDCAVGGHCSEILTQIAASGISSSSSDDRCFRCFSCSKTELRTHSLTATMECDILSSQLHKNQNSDTDNTYTCSKDAGSADTDIIGQSRNSECNSKSERLLKLTQRLTSKYQASPFASGDSEYNSFSSTSVEIPPFDPAKCDADCKSPVVEIVSDFATHISDVVVFSTNTVSPKSFLTSNTNNLSVSPLEHVSPVWHSERKNVICSGFGDGPRKRRTQVHYALPTGGSSFISKQKPPLNQNGPPFRRIRRAGEKRTSDGSRGSQRNLELLACAANVLITLGDRGWRESGARVTLELADHNEWILVVKFSGSTKYSHKVLHAFLPGSTNRYTHAMMWKGGKDWALEFPDRSQWVLFKEMHEECCNRNLRAASMKNIPIPGTRSLVECENHTADYPFTRSSPRYFQQIETDIDMAMNPSKILYDMDSEDENWILCNKKSFQTQEESNCTLIADNLFEKTMDMFEKFAYAQQSDHFKFDEIEKLMVGVAPKEVVHAIYHHWRQKRKRHGMPLIRHLQPPSWERYQRKVREWNQLMTKSNTIAACGGESKAPAMEKPAMFAFCLKPRGMEVPNKGSKHRSQKKSHIAGHSHAVIGDQDGVHALGRRFNPFTFGDGKAILPEDNSPENSDTSPMFNNPTRIYLPNDASGTEHFLLNNDASGLDNHTNLYKNKTKKIGAILPTSNLYNQITIGKRNGVQRWNMELRDCPYQNRNQSGVYHSDGIMQIGGRELDEFRVREAFGAARRASNIARLKKYKAQRFMARADLAVQQSVSALMTADAVAASYCLDE